MSSKSCLQKKSCQLSDRSGSLELSSFLTAVQNCWIIFGSYSTQKFISQVITRKQFNCEILSETLVLFVVRLHSVRGLFRGLFRGLHSIELAVLVA